jgi:plastocyanin
MIWGMNAVPANAATIQVTIDKLVFSPVEVKAKVGDTITHTATARGDWDVMIPANRRVLLPLPFQHEGTDYHHAEVTRRPAKTPSLRRTPCAAIRNE